VKPSVGQLWEETFAGQSAPYAVDGADRAFFEDCLALPHTRKLIEAAGLRGGERVLEAGCGGGKFAVALALRGCRVVALDYAEPMVRNATRLKERAEALYGPLQCEAVRGDVEALAFADGCFDLVFNVGVVEHWLDAAERLAVLREMLRVTRPGGTLFLVVPNTGHVLHRWWRLTRYPGYDCPPMTRYTCRTLRAELVATGCVAVETDGFEPYNCLSQWPAWWPLRKLSGALSRFCPQPRWLRRTFGVSLAAWGRKPGGEEAS
jgi:SAM-dependent methyltransferase